MNIDFWQSKDIWKQSAVNTKWCLIGCAIGDFGTIAFFQYGDYAVSTLFVFSLATINGLITSIILETCLLLRQKMPFGLALKTALGMSFISMLAMEMAMNLTDYLLTGGANFVWWVVLLALFAGFITPWPYNYWRLKKWGRACH